METIRCPRDGCGRVRSGPCGPLCYLSSGQHRTDMIREANAAEQQRAFAELNIDDWKNPQ